ncbi:hypothetical protein [uncultured Draconibacterium sp.]
MERSVTMGRKVIGQLSLGGTVIISIQSQSQCSDVISNEGKDL